MGSSGEILSKKGNCNKYPFFWGKIKQRYEFCRQIFCNYFLSVFSPTEKEWEQETFFLPSDKSKIQPNMQIKKNTTDLKTNRSFDIINNPNLNLLLP